MPTIPLYVSCAKSREVQAFVLDPEQGSLLLLQRKSLPGEVLHLKLSADRRLLLAGTRGEDALHAFSVAPTYGTLRLLGSIPSPGAPTYVGLTPARDMAFVASYRNNLLAAFPLTPRGRPRAATQILPELPRAHAAICPSDGRWLIVPTLGTDTIHSFALNTGHPQPLTSPAAPSRRDVTLGPILGPSGRKSSGGNRRSQAARRRTCSPLVNTARNLTIRALDSRFWAVSVGAG